MRVSIPGMSSSILVELHKIGWPLLFRLSSATWFFLPRAWLLKETDHSEDLSNFIGASPKLDAKLMMHHHDNLSMLMVAPHGCVGWWGWSIFNEKQVVLHQCSLLVMHKDDILHQFTFVALETHSSFTLVQFYHSIGYEPNVSSKKDRVVTKSISFVLISKPSHNFVSSSPVTLFVRLLTLIL